MLHYYMTWLRTLRREEGQDLAEYALILGLIAVVLIGVIGALTGSMETIFNAIKGALDTAASGGTGG